jgi:hypothetical protein
MVRSIRSDIGMPMVGGNDVPVLADTGHIVHPTPLPVIATIIHIRPGPVGESNMARLIGLFWGSIWPRATPERQLVNGVARHLDRIRPHSS